MKVIDITKLTDAIDQEHRITGCTWSAAGEGIVFPMDVAVGLENVVRTTRAVGGYRPLGSRRWDVISGLLKRWGYIRYDRGRQRWVPTEEGEALAGRCLLGSS